MTVSLFLNWYYSNFNFHMYINSIFVCLFVCAKGDTIWYHGGLRSRELGQAPMLLVFQTHRQALSSHPRQQMVWLFGMPNWYTINHQTTLHTHNETQRPTTARRWHFVLWDVSSRQSCHLSVNSNTYLVSKYLWIYFCKSTETSKQM